MSIEVAYAAIEIEDRIDDPTDALRETRARSRAREYDVVRLHSAAACDRLSVPVPAGGR